MKFHIRVEFVSSRDHEIHVWNLSKVMSSKKRLLFSTWYFDRLLSNLRYILLWLAYIFFPKLFTKFYFGFLKYFCINLVLKRLPMCHVGLMVIIPWVLLLICTNLSEVVCVSINLSKVVCVSVIYTCQQKTHSVVINNRTNVIHW